jgi:prevent-host-death family protein
MEEPMTRTATLDEAATSLATLVEAAAAGEEIVITAYGRPRARLVPVEPPQRRRAPVLGTMGRVEGLLHDGRVPPLPDDVLAMMVGDDPDDPLG